MLEMAKKGKVKPGNRKDMGKNGFLSFAVPLSFDTFFCCFCPKP